MASTSRTPRVALGLRCLCCIAVSLAGARGAAAQAAADSTARAGRRDSTVRAADTTAPAAPTPPVDTVLARACGPRRSGVLGVLFRARATDTERAAAAQEVGGRVIPLGGREAYIRLPEDGMSLRGASDRLIQSSAVSAVTEIPCPG